MDIVSRLPIEVRQIESAEEAKADVAYCDCIVDAVLETRPKRATCGHRAGSITHSSAQMGLSKAWATHPAANYCAQDDSLPHQLEATRVFGRTSRHRPHPGRHGAVSRRH